MEKPKATAEKSGLEFQPDVKPQSEKKAADPASGFYSLKYFRTCLTLHLVWQAEDALDQAQKSFWREFSGSEEDASSTVSDLMSCTSCLVNWHLADPN